ncbi:MAG: LLM class flavin-dependent oxidoreductase [Chloroflexi bacterium]|nr:LLM class flavin-dependent oxidoreductase [Chloroflexota bacterium]
MVRDVDAAGERTPRLRFGLALDWSAERMPLDALFREYLPLIQLAERHGFESVWVGQHFPTQADELSHPPSPLLVLAALAPHTSMTLGTGVLLLPMWNPITLAYEAAVLDQLCGGRLIVGVGIGRPRDWRKFGLPREVIGQRTDEMLEALRALWSGADGYAGSAITCPGAIWPRPTQPQGPPLFVGGSIGRAIRRAARLGDGWYAGSTHLLSAIAETTARYHQELVAAGKDPATARVAANRSTVIAETREQAWCDGGPSLEQLMHTYRKIGGTKTPDGRELTEQTEILPLVAEENCLLGTPDEVAVQLERYVAAGVTDVMLRVAPSDMPLEVGRRSIELAGRHIIPHFR